MTNTIHRLSDDHLDLIMTAALQWRVLPTSHQVASAVERRLAHTMANQVGHDILVENLASIAAVTDRGRARLAGSPDSGTSYSFTPVDQLVPVEVIKAVHAARDACRHSSSWEGGKAHRWLDAVLVAATYRLDGFSAAPWLWTRPQHRTGHSIGVALRRADQLPIPGLVWVEPDELADHWQHAALIIILVDAVSAVSAELPARTGVFVLTDEHDHDPQRTWSALISLDMEALSLFWPSCGPWLADQLRVPAPQYTSYRSQS